MALITGQPRSATVTSISENCVVREITANEFKLIWKAKPEALLPVLKMVTERLSSSMQMIDNLQRTLRNGNGI
jgi:CRP-like cAMP-binding protein